MTNQIKSFRIKCLERLNQKLRYDIKTLKFYKDSVDLYGNKFKEFLNYLSPRERKILTMRLSDNFTYDYIGGMCGVHRERIRQILARIKEKFNGFLFKEAYSQLENNYKVKNKILIVNKSPIEILGLSPRPMNALINGGIDKVEDLCNREFSTLLQIRGIGKKGMEEIKECLESRNLSLLNQ